MKKAAFIVRIILGAYLVWIGARLLIQALNERPSNMMLLSVMSVVFIVFGAFYVIVSARTVYRMNRGGKEGTGNSSSSPETAEKSEKIVKAVIRPKETEDVRPGRAEGVNLHATDIKSGLSGENEENDLSEPEEKTEEVLSVPAGDNEESEKAEVSQEAEAGEKNFSEDTLRIHVQEGMKKREFLQDETDGPTEEASGAEALEKDYEER